jgi:hypothetical protein
MQRVRKEEICWAGTRTRRGRRKQKKKKKIKGKKLGRTKEEVAVVGKGRGPLTIAY